MKIAFFVNQFPMLSEAFIATSAAALRDSGNDVDIYGFGGETPTGSSVDQATARKLEGRGRNAVLPSTMAEHARAAPKALASVLSGSGLRAINVFNPLVYRRSIKNLSPLYQAAMFRNGRDYDILHCQFATLGEFVLKHRRAGLLGGKMVVHFRGYDISQVVKSSGPRVYEKLFAGADYFVANCEHFRQKAIEIGCPPDRIDVVGSGIELSNFPYRGTKQREGGAIRIVTVGRLIERKGVHVALDALARLARDGVAFHFDVVGDGVMRPELERQAETLGLARQVTFHGARTHREIRTILEGSHIFMATSLTCRDGSVDAPVNTVKEAMATGVLVVGTRHGGIPELVEEGQTGTLSRENDAADLAQALERLLALAPQWNAMAQKSRRRVEETFAIEVTNQKLLNVYVKARELR